MTTEQILTLINLLLGGSMVTTLLFYRSKKKKANAEASKVEVSVLKDFADEWRTIAEKREVQLNTSSQKIDSLYSDISDWRDKHNSAKEEVLTVKLENQQLKFKMCNKKGCSERQPQTGF